MDIPHVWKMKGCLPYGAPDDINPNWRRIYIILFFERKRAILMDKEYTCKGTTETRYARKMVKEAQEKGWISTVWDAYEGGDRPKDYPKICQVAYWVEMDVKVQSKTSSQAD